MSPLASLTRRTRSLSARLDRPAIKAFVGAAALTLGFWGWMRHAPPTDPAGWLNNVFRTLQLVTLQFPTNFDSSIPWQLQIARLLVPILAVLATFRILVGAITRPVRLALLPRSAGHIVVCGAERLTNDAVQALATRGRQIVLVSLAIEPSRREALEGIGLTIVEADPLLPTTFPALNLRRASALFLTDEDDLVNLNRAVIAMAALDGRPDDLPPLLLGVLLESESLATELDAALDGLARCHHIHYHRLCPDREGVRLELRTLAPVFHKPDLTQPSHILVVGLTGQWTEILAQLIAAAQDHPDKPPRLTLLLDPAEQDALTAWRNARPDLPLVADIAILPRTPPTPPENWRPPDLAVILLPDAEAIATALQLRRPANPLAAPHAPILVRQSRHDLLLARLGEIDVKGRDLSRLVAFGGLLRPDTLERVLDRKGDDLPIALHAAYLNGIPSAAAQAAWDDLPENLREANRAAAAHAPILFAAAGLHPGPGSPIQPTPAQMNLLARIEHNRWIADRIERGWRAGPTRDDAARIHPSMIPFDALPPEVQAQDTAQVKTLIAALSQDIQA